MSDNSTVIMGIGLIIYLTTNLVWAVVLWNVIKHLT